MDAKLTLKLEKAVIDRAKEYASSHNRSLSKMIESYLQSLSTTENTGSTNQHIEISPFVKNLSTGIQIPADLDVKEEYSKHLHDKYK